MLNQSEPRAPRGVLDLAATPERLRELVAAGHLQATALPRALALATASPPVAAWRTFVATGLLLLGCALALSGVVYFFAYNWAALGRFAKFILIEAGIAGTALLAWRLGLKKLSGRACLSAAAVLVGPLLAVYGQTYQTGADPYELFLGWAALIAPWVAAARFAPLLLGFIALLDTALGLSACTSCRSSR